MPRAHQVSFVMHPTPDIANSTVCSASCAQRCTTNKPNSDGALRGLGDAERARDNAHHHAKAEFGATDD